MDILAKFSSLKDGMDGKDGMESILILDELGTENYDVERNFRFRFVERCMNFFHDFMIVNQRLASSVEECANWCTWDLDCCVFEYSPSSKQCQLHKKCHPNHAQYGDFMFCRKINTGTYTVHYHTPGPCIELP